MQPPKNLTFAFAGKGKQPDAEPEIDLFSTFKTAAVMAAMSVALAVQGPKLCEELDAQKKILIANNSEKGIPVSVTAHFGLLSMIKKVDTLTYNLRQGGPEGAMQVKDAQNYLNHLRQFGIN